MSRRGAVLVGLLLCSCMYPWRGRTRCEEAREAVSQLKKLVRTYEISHGRMPSSINDLVHDGLLEEGLDPWGRPYKYELDGNESRVWSGGPRVGTRADDITEGTRCPSPGRGCAFNG